MKLTIEASTIEELISKVMDIANKFNVDLSENTKTPVTAEVVQAVEAVVVEEKKEKKAPKKEKVVEVAVEAVVETPKVEVTYVKKDIADACQAVSEAKGLEAAREVLTSFGAKRISDVKESDYAAFISACNKAKA